MEAEAAGWTNFKTDLTDQRQFAWRNFLPSVPGGANILTEGVAEVWLVWVGRGVQRAGVYTRQLNGQETVVFPQAPFVSQPSVADINWAV
jgi:hypothetical protein